MASLIDDVFAHAREIAESIPNASDANAARDRMLAFCSAHPRRVEVEEILISGARMHAADFEEPYPYSREQDISLGAIVILAAAMERI